MSIILSIILLATFIISTYIFLKKTGDLIKDIRAAIETEREGYDQIAKLGEKLDIASSFSKDIADLQKSTSAMETSLQSVKDELNKLKTERKT